MTSALGQPAVEELRTATDNPYVGPRSYRHGERLYGREREIGEVHDVLIAERIVLLYSPSGAGKSSLLEAGLRPELEGGDFDLLPTVRVGHDVPPSLAGTKVRNRYTLSTLLSLEEGRPAERQLDAAALSEISIGDYLSRLTAELDPGCDPCLFFDQFEELFTLDPTDHLEKAAFLEELGIAMRDRSRWALFAMREDFIAQLDPVLALMPRRFATRYRLDLLAPPAAMVAARRPAEDAGVAFSSEAAQRLVDDLRRVRVQRGTTITEEHGPYVEPVQLQVVCRRLWDSVLAAPPPERTIGVESIVALGNVDDALAEYYVGSVRSTAAHTGVTEREIREWFEDALVSEQGFRTQALSGPGGEQSSAVLRELEDAHIIRADSRRGALWYELSHDRLVAPLRASNLAWRAQNLSALQLEASNWDKQSRPAGLLVTGDALVEVEKWAADHDHELSALDREYLQASREEQQREERELRASRRTRRLAVLSSTLAFAALIGLIVATVASRSSARSAERARASERVALAEKDRVTRAEQKTTAALGEAVASATAEELAKDQALRAQRTLVDTLKQTASFANEIDAELVQIRLASGIPTVDSAPVAIYTITGPDASCVDAASAHSTPVGLGRSVGAVSIINRTDKRLSVAWLSTGGDRLAWDAIDPGSANALIQLAGWQFLVTDPSGRCMAVL